MGRIVGRVNMVLVGKKERGFLFSYLHNIDPTNYSSPNCPLCKMTEHNTVQLFNCQHLPIALDPDSLWSNLVEAAALLDLWTGSSKPAPPVVE